MTRRADADLPEGVLPVVADLADPDSVARASAGAAAVFLLWTAPPATAASVIARLAAHRPRLVLMTSPHQTPHPFFQRTNPMAAFHAELERLVRATGLPSTIVRPGMFASNCVSWWNDQIAAGDVVRWPFGSLATAPIDERDVGEVAACALLDPAHAGHEYVLTGPRGITHAGQVRAIGHAIGRDLAFRELTPDEFRQQTAGRWPPVVVEMLLRAWQAADGHPPFVTRTVEEVLGRPARSFETWAADHAADFEPATTGR